MKLRGPIAAAILAAFVTANPVTVSANDLRRIDSAEDSLKEAEKLAKEAAERLMMTLQMLLEYVPQYEMPEVLDNGDIIIRRKQPGKSPEQKEPDVDHTKT
jgi:hypothetical protein